MTNRIFRTNPTRIKAIERSLITISVHRSVLAKIDKFSVDKLDLQALGLPPESPVVVVAYSGFDEMRFDIGTVGATKLPKNSPLAAVDASGILFRVFVTQAQGCKILASCEAVRPVEENQAERTPLLFVHYDSLGERMWDLKLSGGDRPVLRVNESESLNLRKYFEDRDPLVRGLIVPQAFEQALIHLVLNPARDEEPSAWQNVWAEYLERLGAPETPSRPDSFDEMESLQNWAKEVSRLFAHEVRFVTKAVERSAKSNE